MPYWHVKVFVREGAHSFIQGEEKKKPAAKFGIMCIMSIIYVMNIIAIKDII
jgi:hypothetical protein